jgi:hypothetical protein
VKAGVTDPPAVPPALGVVVVDAPGACVVDTPGAVVVVDAPGACVVVEVFTIELSTVQSKIFMSDAAFAKSRRPNPEPADWAVSTKTSPAVTEVAESIGTGVPFFVSTGSPGVNMTPRAKYKESQPVPVTVIVCVSPEPKSGGVTRVMEPPQS